MAAIYTPFYAPERLTTTLYPVEVSDAMVFGIAMNGDSGATNMGELAYSAPMIGSIGMLGGTLVQERWFIKSLGHESAPMIGGIGMLGGTLVQERWFIQSLGHESAPMIGGIGMLGGTLISMVVDADSPDEKLQLSCRIGVCSMEEI